MTILTTYVLDARLKMNNGEDLTPLEQLLCDVQIESRVKELRKLSGRIVSNVIYASQVKQLGQVQPETTSKSRWKRLPVTIHDESLLTPRMPRIGNANKVALATFLKFLELHQNVTLLMQGVTRKWGILGEGIRWRRRHFGRAGFISYGAIVPCSG